MKTEELRKAVIDKYMKKFGKINSTWTINLNGKVDVEGDVGIYNSNFTGTELPFKFGIVNGVFNVYESILKNMKNFIDEIGNHFYCCNTKISSLEYLPKKMHLIDIHDNAKEFTEEDVKKTGTEYSVFMDDTPF